MLKVQDSCVKPLIQIIEWNIEAYFDPGTDIDEFKIRLGRVNSILEGCSGTNDVELDDGSIFWIKEAIEHAWNHQQECGVAKEDVDMLYRWILPIFLKRKKE